MTAHMPEHFMSTLEWSNWSILAGCACGHITVYRRDGHARIFDADLERLMRQVTKKFRSHLPEPEIDR